jgi:hypothetical protein
LESRTTIKQVEFRKPFRLAVLDGLQAPGIYTVHTEQEMLDTSLSQGWRQTAMTLEIFRDGAMEHVAIEAQDLSEALARDGAGDPPFPLASSSAPPGRSRRVRDLLRRGGRR